MTWKELSRAQRSRWCDHLNWCSCVAARMSLQVVSVIPGGINGRKTAHASREVDKMVPIGSGSARTRRSAYGLVCCGRRTALDEIGIRWPVSLRIRCGGRDSKTMPQPTNRCGRIGVSWFAAQDRMTTPHDSSHVPTTPRNSVPMSTTPRDGIRSGGSCLLRRDSIPIARRNGRCGRLSAPVRWFAAHDPSTAPSAFAAGPLCLWYRRDRRDPMPIIRRSGRYGRRGPPVRWLAAHDPSTTLSAFAAGPLHLRYGGDCVTTPHCMNR